MLVEHDPEVTGALTHLLEGTAAAPQQVDQRHTFGIEKLEGEPHPLGRILDARESIGHVGQQVLAPAQMPVLVAERDAHLGESVLGLARALRRFGRPPGEALQRHVERLLLDAGGIGREAQLLQGLNPDADLVRSLADGIGCADRAVDQGSETAHRGHAGERATESANAGAQQLGLAAHVLEPARSLAACRLDSLKTLLTALADGNQLRLDLAAAFDREPDGVCLRASGHGSACVLTSGACESGCYGRS
jgi:hypothetical protein